MTDPEYRKARIERLLSELEYEIVRGVMEREIEPFIHFSKIFPCSGRGVNLVSMEFHVFCAAEYAAISGSNTGPKLRVVDND